MYEVTIGTYKTRGKKFDTLAEALRYAVAVSKDEDRLTPPMVWDDSPMVVAVVTNDANGTTLHRLIPEQWVEKDDKKVWTAAGASPGFNRK